MRWTALIWALPFLVCALPAGAQDIDDLDDLDVGVVLEDPFIAGVQPNTWGLTFLFGYRNVSNTLLQAEGIIVDVEFPDEVAFADMELKGQQSFAPQVRLSRTFGRHFALELGGGFSLGDYKQNIKSEIVNWVDPDGENEVTETETQKGSYWIWNAELSGVWYPRGKGVLQPYLIGGIGQNWFDIDTSYIDGVTSSLAFSYGLGLRIVGDELYSIRMEVRNYHTALDHAVGDTFRELPNLRADRLIKFPVSSLVDINTLSDAEIAAILESLDLDPSIVEGENAVTVLPVAYGGYEEETFMNLWISLGFEATF
jgi:hypothetical protein